MKIFLNSLPKSGTNYLEEVVKACGFQYSSRSLTARGLEQPYRIVKRLYRGRSLFENNFVNIGIDFVRPFSLSYVDRSFGKIKDFEYMSAHANYSPLLDHLIKEKEFIHIIIVRNPRDVMRSYIEYAQKNEQHLHHAYHYKNTVNDLVMRHITGGKFGAYYLDPWHIRLERISSWLSTDAIFVKYEDLIQTHQKQILTGTTCQLSRLLKTNDLSTKISSVYGKSKTFNRGEYSGDWHIPGEISNELAKANKKFCEIFEYENKV